MEVTNYGATLMRLQVPNTQGKLIDVVVGLPKAEDYASKKYQTLQFCLGATIGRYAGRISSGGFRLNNNFYALENDITIHGGRNGFDTQMWKVEEINKSGNPFVMFSLESKADNNGFPGNLKVFAKYQLLENRLQITYTAITDSPTVINLTNHSYFNLDGKGSVKGNTLYVNSDQILETNERLIPTGNFLNVKDTPFEYKNPKPLHFEGHYGLDTPFVLNEGEVKASLFSETSGIEMQVCTNQPSLVLFTPQDFPKMGLRDNDTFTQFPAICFECQNFPDAPNQPSFPNSVLLPGETYVNEITYSFTLR